MCASGDGSNYRGTVSISARGHSCLHWDLFSSWKHYQSSKGLGPHNNCRNPNRSLKPWCRVRRGKGTVREFCHIRKCEPETGPVTTVQPEASVDTELTCGERVERPRFKVVGGLVTPIQSHPWVSAIYHQRVGFLCGGSLITPCWVLTAAHCFAKINIAKLEQLSVYLGKSALNETDVKKEQKFTVEQLVLHSGSAAAMDPALFGPPGRAPCVCPPLSPPSPRAWNARWPATAMRENRRGVIPSICGRRS
ncbi:hypothetical protein NHX12_022354 [Muraenolepis orangiensis]|uniref:trypsin n=1 Tax=Muraenolepis orangiensis TaxID=630683 RepID=A0A9Q0EN25_9TELE|nr:hypothetical protein NHX12_022354 [Muraenolepis orangiensis]